MALRDVKDYYVKLWDQYSEMNNDLADFEEALKVGQITEEQMSSVREDVEKMKINIDRLAYILFLFEIPNKTKKKTLYKKTNESLQEYFHRLSADKAAVIDENIALTALIRDELKKLKQK